MKLSISLAEDDVAFLDSYASEHESGSRSAAIQKAVRLLRASQLEHEYSEAFREWEASGEAELWDATARDGLA
jgi:Arc/MetJ-type ribon-helix-helix transcriptional regulator